MLLYRGAIWPVGVMLNKTLVMMGINKKVMSVQCIPVDSHAYL